MAPAFPNTDTQTKHCVFFKAHQSIALSVMGLAGAKAASSTFCHHQDPKMFTLLLNYIFLSGQCHYVAGCLLCCSQASSICSQRRTDSLVFGKIFLCLPCVNSSSHSHHSRSGYTLKWQIQFEMWLEIWAHVCTMFLSLSWGIGWWIFSLFSPFQFAERDNNNMHILKSWFQCWLNIECEMVPIDD